MNNKETPQICILGAGFSGLTVALEVKRVLKWDSFTIYEKNEEIGGAWFVNTYPGVECDFPSHFYSWSFEPNPDWSRNYAGQAEILSYMKRVADKYEIYKHLRGGTCVESVIWNNSTRKWKVQARDVQTGAQDEKLFDFVFLGFNLLWQPNKPKEYEAFKGPCMHTAEWDHEVVVEGKIVGVVGTGSTAVQIIPAISDKVQTLHSFQRSPAWVLPKQVFNYHPFIKWIFKYIPIVLKLYRWKFFWEHDYIAGALIMGSKVAQYLTDLGIKTIREGIRGKPELADQLVPNYTFGCKVVSLASNYFQTLALPKVKVHSGRIREVTANGLVKEDGEEIPLDVLILATGFKAQEFFGPMNITGVEGANILKMWKEDRPRNYNGICNSLTPNMFFIGGPYGVLASTTGIFMYECQAQFAIQILKNMDENKKNFFVVEESAEIASMAELDFKNMKHVGGNNEPRCESWLKNEKGQGTVGNPVTAFQYWKKTRVVDFTHFEFS